MVMATGALSLSFWYLGLEIAAELLIYLNIFIYIVLLSLNIIRLLLNTDKFLQDISDHGKGHGLFTLIAGTEVLRSQMMVIKGLTVWGCLFRNIAIILWL